MNENNTGIGMTFLPNKVIKNRDHINILSALPIVQAQTGMCLIKGSKPSSIYGHAY